MKRHAQITEIIDTLEARWRANSDWRLGQLIVNLLEDQHESLGIGRLKLYHLFHLTDEELLDALGGDQCIS